MEKHNFPGNCQDPHCSLNEDEPARPDEGLKVIYWACLATAALMPVLLLFLYDLGAALLGLTSIFAIAVALIAKDADDIAASRRRAQFARDHRTRL